MLNPSFADDKDDDPQSRRLINFTKNLIMVGNIFATILRACRDVF